MALVVWHSNLQKQRDLSSGRGWLWLLIGSHADGSITQYLTKKITQIMWLGIFSVFLSSEGISWSYKAHIEVVWYLWNTSCLAKGENKNQLMLRFFVSVFVGFFSFFMGELWTWGYITDFYYLFQDSLTALQGLMTRSLLTYSTQETSNL